MTDQDRGEDSVSQRGLLSVLAQLPAHLTRITSSGRFIPEIDGLRFIAVMSVFCYHVNYYLCQNGPISVTSTAQGDWLHQILITGNFGVQLFFTISGFILSLPFALQYLGAQQPVNLNRYFLRRVTRLEPPYLISLLVYFCMRVFITHQWTFNGLLPHLFTSIFYINNLVWKTLPQINFVTWSLEIEIQFYILAPFVALIFMIRSTWLRRLLLVTITIALASRSVLTPVLPFTIVDYMHYFLIGFLLSDLYVVNWKDRSSHPLLWDLIASISWLSLSFMLVKSLLIPTMAILCIFFAYAGAFRGQFWNKFLRQPWIFAIGGMCYTIYLYHPLCLAIGSAFTLKYHFGNCYAVNVAIQMALLLPFTIAICTVLFLLTEKPFMRPDWPHKIFKKNIERTMPKV